MTTVGRRRYVVGLLALLVVAAGLGIAAVIALTAPWRIESPQYARGTVTGVVPAHAPGSDSQRCHYTVTYEVAGRDYSFDAEAKGPCPYSSGDRVDVVFSSAAPQSGQLDQPAPWPVWLALASSIVVGALSVSALRQAWRRG